MQFVFLSRVYLPAAECRAYLVSVRFWNICAGDQSQHTVKLNTNTLFANTNMRNTLHTRTHTTVSNVNTATCSLQSSLNIGNDVCWASRHPPKRSRIINPRTAAASPARACDSRATDERTCTCPGLRWHQRAHLLCIYMCDP